MCSDCGQPESSGGNNGRYDEHASCTSNRFGTSKEKRKRNWKEVGKNDESEDNSDASFYSMVREFVANRNNSESDETMASEHSEICNDEQERKTIQIRKRRSEDYEGVHSMVKRRKEGLDELFIRAFRGLVLKRRVIHDIWEIPSDGLGERFRRNIIQPVLSLCNGTGSTSKGERDFGRGAPNIFIIAKHEEHLHVIHDCAYSGSTCRCLHIQRLRDFTTEGHNEEESKRWESTQTSTIPEGEVCLEEAEDLERRKRRRISTGYIISRESVERGGRVGNRNRHSGETYNETDKKKIKNSECIEPGGRRLGCGNERRGLRIYGRKSCPSSLLGVKYWQNLSEYLNQGHRSIYFYVHAGRVWADAYEARVIPLQRLFEAKQDRILEEKNILIAGSTLFEGLPCLQSSDEASQGNNETSYENQKGQSRKKASNRLEKWLESFIITPTKNIIYTGHWTQGPFRYMPKNKQLLLSCFHNINQNYVDMSYREIFLKTRKISMNKLIYVAPWNNVGEYYYDIPNSVAVLESLLLHQHKEKTEVYNFLKNLFYVIDKKVPKRNTLCVIGPACSGKNFFFDCVIHSCVNFGQIGNFNKYDRFPLQDALQRRILLWNEPNFEPGAEEVLKLIFGGDTCPARIKYEGDACLQRTPVIVLTNRDVIPNDSTFTSRVWKHYWREAPYLKHISKKPHPLSVFYLMLKYNILSRKNFVFEDWEKELIK